MVLFERILDITHFFNMNELVFSIVFLDITGSFLNLNELVILIVFLTCILLFFDQRLLILAFSYNGFFLH